MLHRHLKGEGYSPAQIDDIIECGGKNDWILLQQAVRNDPSVAEIVYRIASHNLNHPYTIRYGFWLIYSKRFGGMKIEK